MLLGELSPRLRDLIIHFADRAAGDWRLPGAGMWEARDAERNHTSSKVMLWVALDRAIRMADRLGGHETDGWRRERDALRRDVLERAWSLAIGAYAGAYDSDELGASVLLVGRGGPCPSMGE